MCTLVNAIPLPAWLAELETKLSDNHVIATMEEQARFTIRLALENVKHGTGGPFGAAIFHCETGKLIAVGVNCVVPSAQSWAHAEMTAFAHAQNKLGSHELKNCRLVTSCEPCAMCFGATPWSGVCELVYAAPGTMARAIGFDEGDKPDDWHGALEKRGIRVFGPMLEEEAVQPFNLYSQSGIIY